MVLEAILKITQVITPLLVFILGIRLLRSIESAKAQVERQSYFTKKWADCFFETCHEFMRGIERVLALLTHRQRENPNDERGIKQQQECTDYVTALTELELRIRRMVTFAPKNEQVVNYNTSTILQALSNMFNTREGNVDKIFSLIVQFNEAVKRAHGEMLINQK